MDQADENTRFGSQDMQLPQDLRKPLMQHLEHLRERFKSLDWGGRIGFGKRPAIVVIDLALFWTEPQHQMGSNVDSVVEATCAILNAARNTGVPIFFTTYDHDPADPPSPKADKCTPQITPNDTTVLQIDPRLGHQPAEKIIRKKYASAFKGTNFHEILASLGVDTLIVTGVSTSHCVYATCRDACDSYRIIVPRQAVGERCELLHEVNLFDIDLDLGDVMPCDEVVKFLENTPSDGNSNP